MENQRKDFLVILNQKKENILVEKQFHGLNNFYNFNVENCNIDLGYSSNVTFVKDKEENVIILLAGNIYQDDIKANQSIENYILEKYDKFGIEFISKFNGSFCMFVVDRQNDNIYFITDRLNTRKIFYAKFKNKIIFATKITDIPLNKCKLSYAGIASYLINGIPINDLTIFENVKNIERSSLFRIKNFKIYSHKYWSYKFTNEYKDFSKLELAKKLNRIYKNSIQRRIKGKKIYSYH